MSQPKASDQAASGRADELGSQTSPADTEGSADSSVPRPTGSAVGRHKARPVSWILGAGAVAGAITAIVALGKLAKDAVSPAPPSVVRAAVTNVRIEPHRTEYNYLASHPEALRREEAAFRKEGLSPSQIAQILQKRGVTVQFTVEPRGPPEHAWYLTESLYDDGSGQRDTEIDGDYLDEYRLVPHAGERAVTFPSWIQYPTQSGVYFVEIEATDKKGTNATGVSAPFRSPG